MKNVFLMFTFIFLGVSTVFAQSEKKEKVRPKLSKECKAELHTYHEKNIYPQKKVANDKFIASLSKEDLKFVNKKREEHKTLKKEVKANRKNGNKEGKAAIKTKRKALMESMQPFLERNKEAIDLGMAALKEHRKEWKENKKTIRNKYWTAEEKAQIAAHQKKHAAKKGKNVEHKKNRAILRFVFWTDKKKDANLEE